MDKAPSRYGQAHGNTCKEMVYQVPIQPLLQIKPTIMHEKRRTTMMPEEETRNTIKSLVELRKSIEKAHSTKKPKHPPRWEKCEGCPYKLWCKYYDQPLCMKR